MDWLKALTDLLNRKPLIIFRFSQDEWAPIRESLEFTKQFTVARSHRLFDEVRVPTVGLLIGKVFNAGTEVFIGFVKSHTAITTLQSRVKFTSVLKIYPSTEDDLLHLVTKTKFKSNLRTRLESENLVIPLSPKLSVHLAKKLAAREENHKAMRAVIEQLNTPKTYSGNRAIQQDAVNLSLRTFGLSSTSSAIYLETADDRETALAHVNTFDNGFVRIFEDAVLEHDARKVPGFSFLESDLTGRAIFRNNKGELLEVITANRRPLEEVFGVDLIYFNAIKQNIVMVQYKMLEPKRNRPGTDWIYYPDPQLEKEMDRMKRFSKSHSPGPLEYRINPQVFYLRFVKRDLTLGKSTVTMPIDHFDILRQDPDCKGPKGAFRITYDTLDGRYLRQEDFLSLVSSGYIGAFATTTTELECLIRETLKNGRAVVRTVHSTIP